MPDYKQLLTELTAAITEVINADELPKVTIRNIRLCAILATVTTVLQKETLCNER